MLSVKDTVHMYARESCVGACVGDVSVCCVFNMYIKLHECELVISGDTLPVPRRGLIKMLKTYVLLPFNACSDVDFNQHCLTV